MPSQMIKMKSNEAFDMFIGQAMASCRDLVSRRDLKNGADLASSPLMCALVAIVAASIRKSASNNADPFDEPLSVMAIMLLSAHGVTIDDVLLDGFCRTWLEDVVIVRMPNSESTDVN